MKTIRERAAEYTARRSPVTLLEGRLMQESFLAGAISIIDELNTVLSVSEEGYLLSNLKKLINQLEEKDEKVEKAIFGMVYDSDNELWSSYDVSKSDVLTWLEKQGEQKPVDKVEPKFKVGDWVVDKQGVVHQIANVVENVTNHTYGYDVVGDVYFNDNTEGVRLWTINDAKDGDVLVSGHLVFIFKVIHGVWLNCHCSVHNDGSFIADSYDLMTNKYFSEVHPASKEQRDLLFKKMKEAGYEWDAEKKELRKIEEKPKWTEEDDAYKLFAISAIEDYYDGDNPLRKDLVDWLKDIKQRLTNEKEKD